MHYHNCCFKIIGRIFIALFITYGVHAQSQEELIDSSFLELYESYFEESRKTIHLHLNKSTYATGEHIWFSAYIYDQKENKVSLQDTYIYVSLIDSEGQEIDLKTVWYSYGIGNGEILLDNSLKSGDYYLRAYTAKMNQFREDDSSLFPLRIINFESQIFPFENSARGEIQLELGVESGFLLDGAFGNCVLRIRDSSDNPVVPDSILLLNDKENISQPLEVSPMGISRFSLVAKRSLSRRIKVYHSGSVYELKTPPVRLVGYTISTDHHYSKEELLVTISTNKATIKTKRESLALLIHKEGSYSIYPVEIDNKGFTEELKIPYNGLHPGINTLTLLTKEGDIKAERLVFKPQKQTVKAKLINIKNQKDSIILYVKSQYKPDSSLVNKASASVLPSTSIADDGKINMSSRFFLKRHLGLQDIIFLEDKKFNNDPSALYDLDGLLLMQRRGRYKWANIRKGVNTKSPNSGATLNIKGYVNAYDAKNDSLKVMLYSADNGIFETVPLDEDYKFKYASLPPLAKNSKISFTLLDKKGKPVYANFFYTIHPNVVRYRHPIKKIDRFEKHVEFKKQEIPLDIFKNTERLDEVVVTADKLTRKELFGRLYGKYYGRKITMADRGKVSLENLILSYGYRRTYLNYDFYDIKRAASWQLYRSCGGGGYLFPAIRFDGVYSRNIMEFSHIHLEYIDEVYYLKESSCDPGLFVVFSNSKYRNRQIPESSKNTKDFIVNVGHDLPSPFERPIYDSLESPSYSRYGIVSWVPTLVSNDHGVHAIRIPNDQGDKLSLELEGFDMDGTVFSNSLEVDLRK